MIPPSERDERWDELEQRVREEFRQRNQDPGAVFRPDHQHYKLSAIIDPTDPTQPKVTVEVDDHDLLNANLGEMAADFYNLYERERDDSHALYADKHRAIEQWLQERFPAGRQGYGSAPDDRERYRWGVTVDGDRRVLYISEDAYREFEAGEMIAALNAANAEERLRVGGPSLWLRTHPADPNRLTVIPWPHSD